MFTCFIVGPENFVPEIGGYSEICLLVAVVVLQMVYPQVFQPTQFNLRPEMAVVVDTIIANDSTDKAPKQHRHCEIRKEEPESQD